MPRALALSPHLDDAAFSCGGTLAKLAGAGWDVTVATAFTRSVPDPQGFALACQLDKGLPPEVDYMAIRRAEDAEACARLGARPLWLDLPEAPHRGYADAAALFGPPHETDAILAPLSRALAALMAEGSDLLLAPQAVGGHVDHVRLVEAIQAVVPARMPMLWWTDFPYAARPQHETVRPFAATMGAGPERAIVGDAVARFAACAAYATQLGFQFGGEDGLRHALDATGPIERFRERGAVPLQVAA
jgi:LmbE family N-acetylglucosaminyl deacetylase